MTRSASKRACRCTATNSVPASHRSRPASDGSWPGTNPRFVGRDAALAERERGVARRLVGIATDGRRPARAECAVLADDTTIGEVTSGNFSPVLGHGIAMAFVTPGVQAGANVVIDVRGKPLPGTVVDMPFLPR